MAGQLGKDVLVKIDIASTFTTIGGGRTKTLTLDQETIDITDSDSVGGWREILQGGAGVRSASIELEGVFKDSAAEAAVLTAWTAGSTPDMQFIMPSFGTFEGAFLCTQIEYSGEYNNAAMYKMTFENAADITFTAA